MLYSGQQFFQSFVVETFFYVTFLLQRKFERFMFIVVKTAAPLANAARFPLHILCAGQVLEKKYPLVRLCRPRAKTD